MSAEEVGPARLGQLIREARRARRWTQRDLAEESGVSIETIKRYENGKTNSPEADLIRNIIRALNIPVVEIPIALGLVTRDELDPPPAPPRQFDPLVEEAIAILRDPDMSETARQGALTYLQFLQNQNTPETRKPGTGESRPRAS
ncbi:helix-turn-helix domain-containing protein [Micromonospora sp. NBC_00421]|uniref:helix-turn-helix domain-containing protein n=1 Tax=Micromonospora sp. NBC_00421 TaxID=2975976 RepID=UPI002E1FEA47